MMHSRIGKLAIILIAVVTAGLMSFGTGLASYGDIESGFGVFADKGGNGEGNGNGNGQGKDKDKGHQDEDNDTENGDEDQGKNDNSENGKSDDAAADKEGGNKGADNRGQGHDKHADDESTPDADGTPTDDKNAKVGICHVTGSESNPTNYIEVSENAVTAHEAHGDVIGVASEDDCGGDAATPGATPEVVT